MTDEVRIVVEYTCDCEWNVGVECVVPEPRMCPMHIPAAYRTKDGVWY